MTISSDNPSASAVISAVTPVDVNGSTATQKPSSAWVAPEPGRRLQRWRGHPACDVEACLAQSLDQLFDQVGRVPLRELVTGDLREVGLERQDVSHALCRRLALSELAVHGCEQCPREELPWHVALEHEGARRHIVGLPIGVEEGNGPIPRWVMRVQMPCLLRQLAAPLPVAGERQQVPRYSMLDPSIGLSAMARSAALRKASNCLRKNSACAIARCA